MRREHGFTLVELMLAATLMIVVLGAALGAVEHFQRTTTRNQRQNDAQEAARTSVDKMARDIRNGAAPAAGSSNSIGRATGTDLVYQAVDATGASGGANTRHAQWVRYCLDAGTATNERIWKQTFSWTSAAAPAVPFAAGTCPDFGVGGTPAIVVDHIVNASGGTTRPVFIYNPDPGANPTQSQLAHVTHVGIDIFVNYDPAHVPGSSELTSGVYLRDQAEPPTAALDAQLGGGKLFLNASRSTDPAGLSMTYLWCDTTTNSTCNTSTAIGQGITMSYAAPSGTRSITLVATNASGASDTVTQQVVVP